MKFAMITFALVVGSAQAQAIIDVGSWKLGRCYVPDGETLGPQMKDNVDLFGLDWIKYWSANAEHNSGDIDSPKTTSAASCCEACESTPDCNMWTWTKSQQGCYLKKSSEETIYVERFDEGRVSGGWEASVHVDTNTFFDGQKTSTTTQLAAFNTNGVLVNHESKGELHIAAGETTACECRECGSEVAHNFVSGSCGVASGTCSATVSGGGCYSSASSGCDCASLTTVIVPQAVDHDVDHLHRRLDAANHLLGVDYPSEDYVKFSNGRPEASTPTS